MKKDIPFFTILTAIIFCAYSFSYADYLQIADKPFEPVLMALFDNEKYLVYADKGFVDRAIAEGSAIMVRAGTRCVEIEQETKQIAFIKKTVSRAILVEGEHKGYSGWVLGNNLKYEDKTSGYFDSGDTIVTMQNGKIIRGNLGKMSQDGIFLNLFDGAADIFLRKENIVQIESTDRGYGYF